MLTKIQKNIGISELRKHLPKYLKDAKKEPLVVSLDRGKNIRVVLDVNLYNSLLEFHEDYQDAKELEKLKKNDNGERLDWTDVKNKYLCK